MKILFICSGNKNNAGSIIVQNQASSLINMGMRVDVFTIKGYGLGGYFSNIFKLRKHLIGKKYDIIHSHYSLSSMVASLAGSKNQVVSLMGSDVKVNLIYKFFIKLFSYFFWEKVIVKSKDMLLSLKISDAAIIPNGVDFNKLNPVEKNFALIQTGWDSAKKHILFAADPNRPEKNFKLAKEAFDLLSDKNIELHFLDNIPNEKMIFYYNSADVILLTSFWEGSPNVIKEAMACNRPIVATNVGDVSKVIGNTDGCYITSFNSNDVKENLMKALAFGKSTTGREDIKHLDSSIVAQNIIELYQLVLSNTAK